MTAVTLSTVWLNLAADPSQRIELRGVAGLERETETRARVQHVAGGGVRLIRRRGRAVRWKLALPAAVRVEVDQLEQWNGETVTARDHRGHKVHGAFLVVPVTENGVSTRGETQVELVELTHSEAV